MKFRNLIASAALAALAFCAIAPANAALTVLCAPQLADTAAARTIGGTGSQIPSGTIYTLNGQGCTLAQQADVGWFLSQGFSPGPPFGANILFTTGALPASGTADIVVGTLPPSTYIQHIIVNNTTANAVGGNLSFGSTANGTDIVASQPCGANCLVFVTDATLSKRIFSTTAGQVIHMAPITSSNSANLTVTIVYGYF